MSSQPPEGNSRQSERLTINKEFDSFDQFIQEYVTNISRTGAFIKTATPLPVGSEVTLRFTVVMDDVEVIEGRQHCLWIHARRELKGIESAACEKKELVAFDVSHCAQLAREPEAIAQDASLAVAATL